MAGALDSAAFVSILRAYLGGDTFSVGLFSNDVEPTAVTRLVDLVEVSDPAYARVVVQPGQWSVEARADGRAGVGSGPGVVFNPMGGSGPVVVRGYFLVNSAGDLAWGERFAPAPPPLAAGAPPLTFVPKLTALNYLL